jgi:hypothetical protein
VGETLVARHHPRKCAAQTHPSSDAANASVGQRKTADGFVRATLEVPQSAIRFEVRAEIITQHNCLPSCGQKPRLFLETLRRPDFDLPIIALGKSRGVERDPYLAWCRKHAVPSRIPGDDASSEPLPDLDPIERAAVAAGGRIVR